MTQRRECSLRSETIALGACPRHASTLIKRKQGKHIRIIGSRFATVGGTSSQVAGIFPLIQQFWRRRRASRSSASIAEKAGITLMLRISRSRNAGAKHANFDHFKLLR